MNQNFEARHPELLNPIYALASACALLSVCWSAQAAAYTFTQLDYPAARWTEATAVGSKGAVVGDYADSAGVVHGFAYKNGNYTQLDPPGSISTQPKSVNSGGQVAGIFNNAAGTHGFLYTPKGKTRFMTLDPPGSTLTQAWAVDDNGQVVGSYNDASGIGHGFIYTPGVGFTTLDPTSPATGTWAAAFGINGTGQAAGSYFDGVRRHGFEYAGGTYITLDPPGSTLTQALGINTGSQATGFFTDSANVYHGFLYDPATLSYTTVDPPATTFTAPTAIDTTGQVTGYFYDGSKYHGFIFTAGAYTLIDPPGATGYLTLVFGMNDKAQVAGTFVDSASAQHGFMATP
ncbi:MAG TPA: hypothetical protein VKP66_13075 [Steroidobacteraceae bacterium]|nr:hypothetical protein [Steroidobacteraceae bacterium]